MDAVEEWGELCRLASPGHRACEEKIEALQAENEELTETLETWATANAAMLVTNSELMAKIEVLRAENDELKTLLRELTTRDNPLDPDARGQATRDKPRQR